MSAPVLPEPERPRLRRGRVLRPARIRLALTLLRLTIIILLGGLAAGGWYLGKKGFSRNWREKVVEELHKRGVEASVRRLTLDPFRGLIARDVRIYDYKKREKTLAVVSEISLDINYAALFHHQPFLNALDIRNGDLSIPLPPAPGQVANAELKKFRAHVYFSPERIEVSQAEGYFCGVRISASGQLIKRESYRPSKQETADERAHRLRLLQTLVTMLQRFRYPESAPELQVKFSGDLSQLEDAHVEAALHGREIVRDKYEAHNLRVAAEWKDHTLTVPRLEWSDHAGNFAGNASWSRSNGQAQFQIRSSVDLKALLGSFDLGAMLEPVVFQAPPLVEASGSASIGVPEKKIEVVGRVALERFAYRAVNFEGLTCEFAWDGTRTMLRDIRLRHRSGLLMADLFDAPNDFRLNLDSSIFPIAFEPLAPVGLRPFLHEWEWQRSPNVHLAIHGTSRDPATWRGDGTLALGRTRFRGVWMESASANLHFGDGALDLEKFRVTRDEGIGTGSFVYDRKRNELRLTNVQTTLKPSDAIMWIEPRFWEHVMPYRFHHPPHVTANGVVQFGAGKQTHLQIDVDAPDGMDYTFIDKVLPFEKIAGELLFTDDRLQILGLKGRLFAGNLAGSADISLAHNDHHYTAKLAVERADFPALTNLYFKYKTSQGALSGYFNFAGLGSDARFLKGEGRVEVTDGNVFAIPVFGPLSQLLNKMFPGAGYSVAHEANAPFTIKEGVIHTDKLKVSGKLFAMLGRGDVNFLQHKLDFDIRIDATGAGLVLTPLYKLFEYHGSGSLTNPVWRPKHL
ncbi:MAG TPA: AsmA-like C-terminal region-containing protein [Chthoniobacterales bacterium]